MPNPELKVNQRKALAALLAQPSVSAAAKACALSERTLYHYLADPTFKAELQHRQDQAISAVTAALVGLSGEAVEVLRGVLNDPSASHSVKVRAALGWLQHTREAVVVDDLVQRVALLEEGLKEKQK